MIRTHLVLSMRRAARHDCELVYFIEIWARGGSRRGASKTFEQVTRKSVSLTKKGRRCGAARSPASCVRDSSIIVVRTGAPGGGGKRMHSGAPPAAAYSIGFEGQTRNTTHTRIRKRQRNADGTSRPPPHGSLAQRYRSARNRVNPPDLTRGKPRIRIRN